MASMNHDQTNKRWQIQFIAPTGKRKSVSMKATRGRDRGQSKAAVLKNHIEELCTAAKTGTSIPEKVAAWAEDLPDEFHAQLSEAGLLPSRDVSGLETPEADYLGGWLDKWLNDREKTKDSTIATWKNARRNLIAYFGRDKLLRDITKNDAEMFERWLKDDQELAPATRRKRVSIAKQMLNSAVKDERIDDNPFSELKTASPKPNKKRQHYVTHDETRKILAACSDAEWRSAVALARYGGLRMPSESRNLRWEDVHWSESTMLVHATKTEHHEDEGIRCVPLFPELRKELTALWEQTEPGEEYVLPLVRLTTNLQPTMVRIIKRAGLVPWPKPWQNMRASRATELEDKFGAFKAAEWCGHTEKIAREHYLMMTDDVMERAINFVSDAHMMQNTPELGSTGQPAEMDGQQIH